MRTLPDRYFQLLKSGELQHRFESYEDLWAAVISGETLVFRKDRRYIIASSLCLMGFCLILTIWLITNLMNWFFFLMSFGIALCPLSIYLIKIGTYPIIVVGPEGIAWRSPPNQGLCWEDVQRVSWWPMRPYLFSRVFVEIKLKSAERLILSIRRGNSSFPSKKRKEFIAIAIKGHFEQWKGVREENFAKSLLN